MPITVVHRSDDRDKNAVDKAGGFKCWNANWSSQTSNLNNARIFITKLMDPKTDVTKLDKQAQAILAPVPYGFKPGAADANLLTVMELIKRNKGVHWAFWVSTSVNRECGGMIMKHLYQVVLPKPLNLYEISAGKLIKIENRRGNLKPCICLDGTSLKDSEIIALNTGPLEDVEISFLTTLKKEWISEMTKL